MTEPARAGRRIGPSSARAAGIIPRVLVPVLASRCLRLFAALSPLLLPACASGAPGSSPPAWTGDFHPPGKPGGSITNTKQCECRACDPADCCGAERTESSGQAPAECNGSYTFSEKCGITVNTCTPRCYSQVWRVGIKESCDVSRPLVCCEG